LNTTTRWFSCAAATLLLGDATVARAEESAKPADWHWAVSGGLLVVHPNIDSPVVHAEADTNVTPVVNLSYFVTPNLALHAAAATTHHRLKANGSDLGGVSIVPFNFQVQWHFIPDQKISPYVGAGVNQPVYYDQGGPVLNNVEHFHSQTGAIAELGVNFAVGRWTFISLDWKRFWMKTDVILKGGPKLETIALDPDAITLAYGIRF
jgi:outer membrane protein